MKYLVRNQKGRIGFLLVGAIVVVAIGAGVIMPQDPYYASLRLRLMPPGYADASGRLFILGTDQLGRDNLSRIILGSRISLLVSLSAVLLSGTAGCVSGALAGYLGGWVDAVTMRIADMQLSVPMILIAIVWFVVFGSSVLGIIIIIGIWGWVQYARVARGMTLSIRETEYVLAARAVGSSDARIVLVHILPNLLGPITVLGTMQVGQAVLLEAALSFLGVGIQPPTPTWGGMLSEGRAYIDTAWWIAVFPGVAITLLVLGANLLGDALRDALDPRISRRVSW
jgi:peptide/nickel transport system permease protein